MKENPSLERLAANLLKRDRWARDVLRQTLLSELVEDADAVVDTEAGMPTGHEVPGEVLVQEFAVHQ